MVLGEGAANPTPQVAKGAGDLGRSLLGKEEVI
jgi:hypothetical protein